MVFGDVIRRSFRWSIAVLVFLLLSACGGGGEDSSGTITVAPASGPGDADAVFPLRIGDTWNYRINETETLNGVTKTATSTAALRVVGTRQLSVLR